MSTMIKDKKGSLKAEPVKIDERGRISLPKSIRDQMGVEAGDTLFMRLSKEKHLEVRKAINPFDALADQAIQEYREGKTKSLEDFAKELNYDLNDDE